MKLATLQVHRPASLAEALDLRFEYGDDAAFYAGGTELLLVMKLGLADFPHLIDLKRIPELSQLRAGDSEIEIGAAVTYRRVEADPRVRREFPSLVRMVSGIGNLRVRATGTLGGNLAFADPHSDPLTFLMAARATLDVTGRGSSTRRIPVDDLGIGPYTTRLEPDEILTTIRVPVPPANRRFVHRHVRFRERPALTVTAAADVTADGISNVTLVVGAVMGVPVRMEAAERLIEEQGIAHSDSVRDSVAGAVEPIDDLDGSVDYKRHLAGVYAVRAVEALVSGDDGGDTWS